eukprot:SAG11_NODE_609_length_8224_cov_5.446154_3_plen_460_part_00
MGSHHAARPGFAVDSSRRLREAAELGDTVAVREELALGADIDAHGGTNWSAIHRAVERRRSDVLALLLASGADPNVTSAFGAETPLHLAAGHGDATAVAQLLAAGAHSLLPNKHGKTPLDVAELRGAVGAGLVQGCSRTALLADQILGLVAPGQFHVARLLGADVVGQLAPLGLRVRSVEAERAAADNLDTRGRAANAKQTRLGNDHRLQPRSFTFATVEHTVSMQHNDPYGPIPPPPQSRSPRLVARLVSPSRSLATRHSTSPARTLWQDDTGGSSGSGYVVASPTRCSLATRCRPAPRPLSPMRSGAYARLSFPAHGAHRGGATSSAEVRHAAPPPDPLIEGVNGLISTRYSAGCSTSPSRSASRAVRRGSSSPPRQGMAPTFASSLTSMEQTLPERITSPTRRASSYAGTLSVRALSSRPVHSSSRCATLVISSRFSKFHSGAAMLEVLTPACIWP